HIRLYPYRDLMQAWLREVAPLGEEWVSTHSRSRSNVKPLAYQHLKDCDPFVSSIITLRVVLNSMAGGYTHSHGSELSSGNVPVVRIAVNIGQEVEHEQKVRLWEKGSPGLYHDRKNRLKAQGADASHTRRTNI